MRKLFNLVILKSKNTNLPNKNKAISINNRDINKTVLSNQVSFGKKFFKCFVGCKDNKKLDIYAFSFQT